MPTPEQSSPAPPKPQRVLACLLCQQRKIKCDRRLPCANCVRARAQCVPASLSPRQRRRRFPERELLERLQRYEALLRENNIEFEPLHTPAAVKESPSDDGRGFDTPDDGHSERLVTGQDQASRVKMTLESAPLYEAKNVWHAMNQRSPDPGDDDDDDDADEDNEDSRFSHDDVRETMIKKVWDQLYDSHDHLLFGSRRTNVALSTLHPEPVQIIRLWQIYLENVNPLLKVTHTPTLQARIIDAISDVSKMSPILEALMFGIYCVSILSLEEDECHTLFGSSKKGLLASYQFGCQQALLNCGVLRSSDRDCLTALYLYLVSVRPNTDPRSLSSMLSVAIRIAQRMGIHMNSTYTKCNALEAEMRRRLWWSLIVFDSRICELSDPKTTTLAPTWDCRIPLNVNDSDLRPEMKASPATHENPTEALFAIVRSELGDCIRHSAFFLDFTNPSLKAIAKNAQQNHIWEDSDLATVEKTMEDRYFKFCNPENSLHFMTVWTARGYLAKTRLLESYSRSLRSSTQQTDTQRNAAVSYALNMLECDTKLMTSPLIKGYLWFVHIHFPFQAYIHIVQDLRKRPVEQHAEKSWEVLSDNYEAHFMNTESSNGPFFRILSNMILQAWDAREAILRHLNPPRIVLDIKHKVMQKKSNAQDIDQANNAAGMSIDGYSVPVPIDFGGYSLLLGMEEQGFAGSGAGLYPDTFGQAVAGVDMNQSDWTTLDWNVMHA